MKYRFFSRKNGFPGGHKIRVYTSCIIEDVPNSIFVDMSGKQIYLKASSQLKQYAKQYTNWYYYPANTIITDIRTLG